MGVHLRAYMNHSGCDGPNPEYCAVYCPKYWSCQLVLDAAKKR